MSLGLENKKFIGIIFISILLFFIGSYLIIALPHENATNSKSSGRKEGIIDHKEKNNFAIKWNHTWGGIETEKGNAVAIDSLENIYVAGQTMSFGNSGLGMYDICLIKYTPSGSQLWNN